jgi:HEAT repeat protein
MKFASRFVREKRLRWIAAGAAVAALASGARAQQGNASMPNFTNAKVETRAISGTLDATLSGIASSEGGIVWVGYDVPMIPARDGEQRQMCCSMRSGNGSWGNCTCDIEDRNDGGVSITSNDHGTGNSGTVKLEGPANMFVLLRIAEHHIMRVRTFTEDCRIDAGGTRLIWLGNAKPDESVAALEKLVTASDWAEHDGRAVGDGALTAIAMQDTPAADEAMESFTASDRPEKLRSQTAFWAGSARGKAGLELLTKMAKSDPDTKVREQVSFGLSVSNEPGSVDEMIRMAHEDDSPRVRGQALFWLAQKASKRVADEIKGAIDNDPDTDVKKRAVFALSQLPKDQGVPMLIQVAKTNKNYEVRKQAMFWLGQSNDPRALAFFEEVLTH